MVQAIVVVVIVLAVLVADLQHQRRRQRRAIDQRAAERQRRIDMGEPPMRVLELDARDNPRVREVDGFDERRYIFGRRRM